MTTCRPRFLPHALTISRPSRCSPTHLRLCSQAHPHPRRPVSLSAVLVLLGLSCAIGAGPAGASDAAPKPAAAAPGPTTSPTAATAVAPLPAASSPHTATGMRPPRQLLRANAPAAAATSDPARPASAPGGGSGAVDPLDRLRDRLTRQLGAEQGGKTGRRATPVVQVENQAPGEFRIQAPAAGARAAAGHAGLAGHASPGAKQHAQPGAPAPHHGPPWGYSGPLGPEAWSSLHPSFSLCGKGQRQSPVDIRDGLPVDLEPVEFNYRPGFFSVTDNGHTVQVQVGGGNAIEVGARRYELTGFHFHLPGEERVDGRSFAMSIHLVHRDAQGRLAVVGLVAEEGPEHPAVQSVWNHLPLERGEFVAASVEFDPAALLPRRRGYYTYMGSLTTPPCTEGVLWIVMQQPIQVSPQQLAIFARLHPMNARPIQPLQGRVIKQSR